MRTRLTPLPHLWIRRCLVPQPTCLVRLRIILILLLSYSLPRWPVTRIFAVHFISLSHVGSGWWMNGWMNVKLWLIMLETKRAAWMGIVANVQNHDGDYSEAIARLDGKCEIQAMKSSSIRNSLCSTIRSDGSDQYDQFRSTHARKLYMETTDDVVYLGQQQRSNKWDPRTVLLMSPGLYQGVSLWSEWGRPQTPLEAGYRICDKWRRLRPRVAVLWAAPTLVPAVMKKSESAPRGTWSIVWRCDASFHDTTAKASGQLFAESFLLDRESRKTFP
jgi:hypothetical protein